MWFLTYTVHHQKESYNNKHIMMTIQLNPFLQNQLIETPLEPVQWVD